MIVVADTSPLNYLLLIDAIDLLPEIFGQVLIPRTVFQELQHPKNRCQSLPMGDPCSGVVGGLRVRVARKSVADWFGCLGTRRHSASLGSRCDDRAYR